MGALELGLIGVVALFAAILAGINVMVALGAVGALGLVSVVGFHAATSMLSTVFFETTHSFHFSVIPLFLLMGMFAMRAGLGEDLFDAAHKWFGAPARRAWRSPPRSAPPPSAPPRARRSAPPPCSPSWRCRRCSTAATTSGSASASIAIAGTLAVMIPPSAVMVIFGILTDSSIGELLIAGVIPGFLFAVVLVRGDARSPCYRHPEYAPRTKETYTLARKALFAAARRAAGAGDRLHHPRALSRRVHADRGRRRRRRRDPGAGAHPPAQLQEAAAHGGAARDGEDLGDDLRHHHLRADLLALPGAQRASPTRWATSSPRSTSTAG